MPCLEGNCSLWAGSVAQ